MKKIREGCKMTELGEIPIEWNIADIGKISEFVGSGITPKGGQSVYKKEGIPFIRSQNVYPEGLFLDNIAYIDEQQNEKMKRTQIKDEDILLNITGASIGRCTVVPIGFGKGNVNQHVCIIRTNKKVNPKYISTFINSGIGKKQIDSFNGGSSREGLNFEQVKGIKVPIPILKEQEQISLILSSVDEQIEITDNLIEKTKKLKKGLMQKLLTKGIGHSKFKDTEIGSIPEEWNVKKFGEIFSFMKSGLSRKLKEEDVGIPCIRSNNIVNGKIDKTDLKYWFLEDDKGANINDYILNDGDILVNFINSIAQIGKTCIYRNIGRKSIYTTNIFRIKVNTDLVDNKFFYYYTQTAKYNMDITLITKPAVNQASFTSVDFKNIIIPIPSIEEQQRIYLIISSVDEKIDQYESKKEKLQELKKGLMQKLLTGKIRVNV